MPQVFLFLVLPIQLGRKFRSKLATANIIENCLHLNYLPLCNFISFLTVEVGLPTFCFAIPGHLNTEPSDLFKSRAILAHQKYWQAKQMKHLNFCSKIIAISKKKKKGPHLQSVSDFIIFL